MATFAPARPSSNRVRDLLLGSVLLFLVLQQALPALRALADDAPAANAPAVAQPMTTAFTHQGRLSQDGVPASGNFYFEFRLFDDLAAGSTVGPLVTAASVPVTNGLFSVRLDFGSVFTGQRLFLQIGAGPNAGSLIPITPRQELTATPYAIYAMNIPEHDHFGESWTGNDGTFGLEVTHTALAGMGLHGVATGLFGSGVGGEARGGGIGLSGVSQQTQVGVGLVVGVGGLACAVEPVGCPTEGAEPGTGVYGATSVPFSAGVFGRGHFGLQGDSVAPTGYGVFGFGNYGGGSFAGGQVGIRALSGVGHGIDTVSDEPGKAGVFARNTASDCGLPVSTFDDYCIGAWAKATGIGQQGIGVLAQGNNVGVYGIGFWGGYFEGKVFTTGTYEPSDARLKTNIGLSAGLDKLLALRPVAFDWLAGASEGDGARHQGLLAQEVREVFPATVRDAAGPASGGVEMLAVNYTELIPVLIRAIQEQQAQIDALREQIAGLLQAAR